jgi:hypothetical protein
MSMSVRHERDRVFGTYTHERGRVSGTNRVCPSLWVPEIRSQAIVRENGLC